MDANEAAVRDAYQVAERKDLAGWVNCFTEDGTFTDESIGVTYRGKQLSQPVEIYAAAFPDMHRELYRFFVDGDTVIVELALQGTHKGSLKSPLGTIKPTGSVLRRVSLEERQDSILQLLPLGNGDLRAARRAVEYRSSRRKALSG